MENTRSIITNMLIAVTLSCTAIYSARATIESATQIMRAQYLNSAVGLFIKNKPDDYRQLRLFLNRQNDEVVKHMSGIQNHLAKNLDHPQYNKMYNDLERAYISLAFCQEAHRRFNEVTHQHRVNVEASISYSLSAKNCENPILRDFVMQSGMYKTWQSFNKAVIESTPKNSGYNFESTKQKVATPIIEGAQKVLAQYKPMGTKRSLQPSTGSASVDPSNKGSQSLNINLPKAPFRHNQQEMSQIANYMQSLEKRIELGSAQQLLIPCRTITSTSPINSSLLHGCSQLFLVYINQAPKELTSEILELEAFMSVYMNSEYQKQVQDSQRN
ncbi:hypothetical protein DBZ36_07995 [Alginatibacterium sediminis]|uniref:Uncharacterized protein n=1 Tax=Alginatibacterium sediminis TaxID=2164068 RepID=A0A420EI39_9ALTE|nr:hypothetical protein [Alginatibacterium sediminis]RKF20369.1 hypothetical protein DBZ36_07995 [Alginatibacterium sediminis]